MVIDVWSDLVCPWCYIGKTRLEKALAGRQDVSVRWRAFELQPGMPEEGVEARPFYEKKFGGAERVQQIFDRVTGVAREDGLNLRYDLVQRAPNTRLAHRAAKLGGAGAVGALFRAHFEEGLNIADRDTILDVLARAGLDAADIGRRLDAGEGLEEVLHDEEAAGQLGVSGVPFFVVEGKLGMSGAQPVETFSDFLAEAQRAASSPDAQESVPG